MISESMKQWFFLRLSAAAQQAAEPGDPLAKLTVVVPSYERQEFVLRQIIYWAPYACRLIVLDGSSSKLEDDMVEAVKRFINISYVHSVKNFSDRLAVADTMLETPYVITLGDDEFHLRSGLRSAINLLEASPDTSGCVGQSIKFNYDSIKRKVIFGAGYPYKGYDVTDPDVASRLAVAMRAYNAATCYAVLTRACWSASWGSLENYSSPYALELQQAVSTYVVGKFQSTERACWMRSSECDPIDMVDSYNRRLSFDNWWRSSLYTAEKKSFYNILSTLIMGVTHLPQSEARNLIESSIEVYLESTARDSSGRTLSWFSGLRRSFSNFIRRNFSSRTIERIRSFILGGSTVTYRNDYDFGDVSGLFSLESGDYFIVDDDLQAEVEQMCELVTEFHRLRELA